jgi:hypothetical protein
VQTSRTVDVNVAALQITQTLGGVEACASVRQAAMVHHQKVAGAEQDANLKFRRSQQLVEGRS